MTVWTRKSGELATATGRDFERQALPLLRAFWPDLVHPPGLKPLDQAGIDLVVWSDSAEFPVVVQCKGLSQEERLVSEQLPQIRKSIQNFRRSDFKCQTYLLLHNRTGEDPAAHKEIVGLLNELIENRKATVAEIWDRQTFLKKVRLKLKKIIENRIVARASKSIESHKRFFRFGGIHVDRVPVTHQQWMFGVRGNIERAPAQPRKLDPSQALSARKRSKWTLLLGHFGLGKSTFALHAASTVSSKLIYVHSSEIPEDRGSVGTNYLMQKILGSLPIFNDFDDVSASEFERLGGTLLRELLLNPDQEITLIIDGLDESTRYSTARGLIQLTNELEELRCPIVLVARKEYFDATFGNFDLALFKMGLDEWSIKGGTRRKADIYTMEEWTSDEVSDFLQQCLQDSEDSEKQHMQSLVRSLEDGTLERAFGNLVNHPLFLQMIAEIASKGRSIPEHPVGLIEAWTRLKIGRDLLTGRPVPWPVV